MGAKVAVEERPPTRATEHSNASCSSSSPDKNPLRSECSELRQVNALLRQAVQSKGGPESLQRILEIVNPRLVTLGARRERTLQRRRRAMEDVVDTVSERIMHTIHSMNVLNILESRIKNVVFGAAGDMVATGEVNFDWMPYPRKPFGRDLLPYFHFPLGNLDGVSFGCCPRPVLEARAKWDIVNQQDPALWRFRSLMLRLQETLTTVALAVRADVSDLQFIINASQGVSTVLKSQAWMPGDRLLLFSCEFRRTIAAAKAIAARHKVELVFIDLPLPCSEHRIKSILKHKLQEIPKGTVKLACIPHVTAEGFTLPVKKLRKMLHKRHIGVLVDGSLAVGQFSVNLGDLAADYYVASLERWMYAPKGTGFIAVAPLKQAAVFPLTVSYFAGQGYGKEFTYTGLQDFSTFLSVRQSFEFIGHVCGGLRRLQSACHSRAAAMVHCLERLWHTRPIQTSHFRGRYHRLPVIPVPDGTGHSQDTALRLMAHLALNHQIQVFCLISRHDPPTLCVRLAVHVFNDVKDAELLGNAVLDLRGNYASLPPVPAHLAQSLLEDME